MTTPRPLCLLALTAGLVACGGGGGGSNPPPPGPQTPPHVTVYLHGARPDVSRVNAYLQTVQLHVADAGAPSLTLASDDSMDLSEKWKTLPYDEYLNLAAAPTIDSAVSLGSMPLPAGQITQLRLNFDQSQSVRVVFGGDASCMMSIEGLPDTGVKLTRDFRTVPARVNDRIEIWLDLDLLAGLQPTADDCYSFAPVLGVSRVRVNGVDQPLAG
jgi:hypothetical protein